MTFWEVLCLVVYSIIIAVLGIYGLHRYQLLRLFYRHHPTPVPQPDRFAELPFVTIQLPLYNEYHVVERLLEAVGQIDYPRDRLQIQVLDDSQDETRDKAREGVVRLAAQGLDIEYLGRTNRHGFKAGALAAGLECAQGEFVLVLDADFVPNPDILQRAIHYFTDDSIGMVQMRWGHLNRSYSLLTRIQSIFLDGHFVVEHTARNRSGRFFNFNGTGGIWRKKAIYDAGGWQHDTLTEDLDLSYRAQLAGWQFLYLPEIEVPGEIPVEINAFKSQQHRWTKGAVQTAKKVLPRIWRSALPAKVKVEATFHLTANLCYIMMLLMALLTVPVLSIRSQLGWERFFIIDLPL
ncbi:MAG: glycosyltransferase, partial [Gemmatimonadetes bacterium]|nr:glycosyltransferase [Gemmatimonadota bacterium]